MTKPEIIHNLTYYLIESGVILAIWSVVYMVLLRKNFLFRANRYFLLLGLIFSSMVPLFQFSLFQIGSLAQTETIPGAYSILLDTIVVNGKEAVQAVENELSSSTFWMVVYLSGLIVVFARFLLWVWQISKLIGSSRLIKSKENTFVLVDQLQTPYSFLWYIFVHPDFASKGKDYRTMVLHELEHVKQGHSYDVLYLELLSIIQWFNPFVWLLRKIVRENHEFLADRAVLDSGIPVFEYKNLLLHQTTVGSFLATSHFNRSLIKNRLLMMAQSKVSRISGLRLAAAIALAFAVSVVYAAEIAVERPFDSWLSFESQSEISSRVPLAAAITIDGDQVETVHDKPLSVNESITIVERIAAPDAKNENSPPNITGHDQNVLKEEPTVKESQVFFIVEEMPMFPGGEEALRAHIANSIRYPASAVERGVAGRVYISFVVSEDGSVDEVKVARGVDPLLDEEAVRVVSELPEWIPGRQRGVAVAVAYTVPINFTIQ